MCVCPAGLNGRDCLKWKEESGVGINRPVLVCVSDGMSPLKWGTCLIQRTYQVALVVKSPSANAGDAVDSGSIRGLGRSPGEEDDNPLQYSCLEDPMDRGAW